MLSHYSTREDMIRSIYTVLELAVSLEASDLTQNLNNTV